MIPVQKLSMTNQRRVILEELRKVTSHPTADEVYEMVRVILPKISMGTVYRNLEVMAEQGIIQKLYVAGKQMRFDGNPEIHAHIRCTKCGRVDDIAIESECKKHMKPHEIGGYYVAGCNVEYYGICPDCRKTSNK